MLEEFQCPFLCDFHSDNCNGIGPLFLHISIMHDIDVAFLSVHQFFCLSVCLSRCDFVSKWMHSCTYCETFSDSDSATNSPPFSFIELNRHYKIMMVMFSMKVSIKAEEPQHSQIILDQNNLGVLRLHCLGWGMADPQKHTPPPIPLLLVRYQLPY